MNKVDNEQRFRIELEEILSRRKIIEILIIGKPSNNTKWLVSLRIAEMIKDYYKIKKEKEVEISFSFLLEDIVPIINKMKPYDIHIIKIQPFYVENMASYFSSESAKKKNFIYVSHEGLSENKQLEFFAIFYIEAISITKNTLKCKIIVKNEKKEIDFSYPHEELIQLFNNIRKRLN